MRILLPVLCLLLALQALPASPESLVRPTPFGPVKGVEAAGTYAWKGIPFARPPLGDLRWQAPVEPEPWTAPRDASAFGPASAQIGRLYGPGLNNTCDATIGASLDQPVGSEDSLTLNIWRPATAEAGLPVIYFIYGGSNVSGYSADPVYDGAALARAANAVVVTGNYRVGVLGWFNLPQLKSPSANFGTLDQIQTLQFISRGIQGFGGDPGNVTLVGQSAGAVNGYALLTSPRVVQASPKLIHKAVLLSGGLAQDQDLPQGAIPTLRSAGYTKAQATRLLLNLVIAAGKAKDDRAAAAWVQALPDAEVAAFLRAQPAAAVLREARSLPKWSLGATSHVPDGKVVADTPLAAIRDGAYLKVPLIVGITRDEGRLFTPYLALSPLLGGKPGLIVDDAQRLRMMLAFDGDAPPTLTEKDLINPAYLPAAARDTGYVDRTGLITTYLFKVNRDAMLGALEAQQKAIWAYQFAWDREPAPWNVVYGAAHAFDLPFLFGNFGPSLFSRAVNSKANLKGRLDLSAAMMGALGTFARTGDPNHAGLGIAWPAWPATLVFDADLETRRLSVR